MNTKSFLLLLPLLCNIGYAEQTNTLISNTIIPHYNENLSGTYPSLNGDQFKEFNKSIINFISIKFDTKEDNYSTEVGFKEIFKDSEILSFSVNYNISNATERYFSKYYVFNLKKKKEIYLSEYLKKNDISKVDIVKNINTFLAPCHHNTKNSPEYCSDMALRNLLETTPKINYSSFSSFFVKKNTIGLAVNSSKFTTTFLYDPRNKRVNLY